MTGKKKTGAGAPPKPAAKTPGFLADMPTPPRKAKPSPDLEAPAASEKVQFNVRISTDRAVYVRVLAAKTGRTPADVVEEALALLEERHGS